MQLSDVNLNDLDVFERGVPARHVPGCCAARRPCTGTTSRTAPGYWAITRYDDLKRDLAQPGGVLVASAGHA